MHQQEIWDRINKVWAHLYSTPSRAHWKTTSQEILWLLACAEIGEKDPLVVGYGKMII